ncbi:hypothetical protein LTR64_003458 [Lithohypha guttulata]|uniref:Uncharacterized protein n=1 Tax=Lithohypha guttulata TaxID=1690604 RepID=A0AAN7Y659_9EURO|nr:hypothetical protein LTR51_000323 [Lithohypha guttulata]KAK5085514.1 hypothetical protein LTR05_004799 [Lithohypha guttulata]
MNRLATRCVPKGMVSLRPACGGRALWTSASLQAQDKKDTANDAEQKQKNAEQAERIQKKKKTMAEMDEEMRLAMEGHAGDGGISGAELEGGKAVSMKRGVKDNMFRYI